MTVQTYRKRPVTIEALQWTGDNARDLAQWCGWCFNTSALGHARIFVAANDAWLDIERSGGSPRTGMASIRSRMMSF